MIAIKENGTSGGGRTLRNIGAVACLVLVSALMAVSSAQALPDGYVYEKVSPEYKGNGEVAGGMTLTASFRASASGDRIIYPADSVFLGAPSFVQLNAYTALRESAGWDNRSISAILPHFPYASFDGMPLHPRAANIFPSGLSSDGTATVIGTDRDPESGERVPNRLYRVDLESGAFQRLAGEPVAGDAAVTLGNNPSRELVAGNSSFSVVYFSSTAQLTADSVAPGISAATPKLYRSTNGEVNLASRSDVGTPIGGEMVDLRTSMRKVGPNSVSESGDVYWFQDQGLRLYRGAASATESVLANQSENTDLVVAPGSAQFFGADPEGENVVFTSSQRLVNQALTNGNRVYLYTHSQDPEADSNLTLISTEGEPADVSAINVTGVWGVSNDTRTVYFSTSGKQLVDGEPIGPGEKLYRWHDGNLEYLATANVEAGGGGTVSRAEMASPDGRYFMFLSSTSGITPEDNGGFRQQYLYDAESGEFHCTSCLSAGSNIEPVQLNRGQNFMNITYQPRRWLSDDGRVFFETTERLLPEDTNGINDIYTWKDGELDLISSGRSTSDVRFADAAADGSTVLFASRDRLSAWDTDSSADLYAARLGGGLPEPNIRPEQSCVGDDCQSTQSGVPELQEIGSRDVVAGIPQRQPSCSALTRRIDRVRSRGHRLDRTVHVARRAARKSRGRTAARLRTKARTVKRSARRLDKRLRVLERNLRRCERRS